MYLNHFHLNKSPFREEPDPVFFFPEAGRSDTLSAFLQDIEEGKPFIKLIGREGTGKTLFGLLLAHKLPAGYDIVSLDNPVGSFEELLRIICLELGMSPAADVMSQAIMDEFCRQLARRKKQKRKVLLIIDEAEKLFLATLERLVRLACDAEGAGVLHFLFIGRPDFDANLQQLAAYYSDVDVNAGYSLEPLSLEETGRYLYSRLMTAGWEETKHGGIFSEEAVLRIYQAAIGNMRLTNILAEDALRKACAEDTLFVLPGHVNSRFPAAKRAPRRFFPLSDVAPRNKVWLAGGAAVLLILLLLVAIWPGGRNGPPPAVMHRKPVEQVKSTEQVAKKADNERNRKTTPIVEEKENTTNVPPEAKPEKPEVRPLKVVLQPDAGKKTGPGKEVRKEKTAAAPRRNGDKLYEARIRASARWLAWAYRDGFTIQLMMLSSAQAKSNLENMLIRNDYYTVKDNLYILSKTSPPTLFVFYGLYDTMKDARKACSKMPNFLRKHHPYALAIRKALKKTED